MQRTKIEWTDFVWNPIKGICPVNCKLPDGRSYCYAKRMYQRFGWNPKIRIAEVYPNMIFMPLYGRKKEIVSRKVFVCSTFELFHPSVKKEWRDWIFDVIEYNSNITFQILTKFPQNIDRAMPKNVWLGVTVDNVHDFWRARELERKNAKIKFISFEPLLSKIWSEHCYTEGNFRNPLWVDWVIVGRLTGYGRKHDPSRDWIEHIVKTCYYSKTPVFLKNNLKDIWGEPLIQEFPVSQKE